MDSNEYIKMYQRLCEISECDSDIYMSEEYENLLQESGAGTREDNIVQILQMQLAAEEFKDDMDDIIRKIENNGYKVELQEIQKHFIKRFLERKLKRYSAEEQRAIIIEMLGNTNDLLKNITDAGQIFQMMKSSIEELQEQLEEAIAQLSSAVLQETMHGLEEIDESNFDNGNHTFSSGAGACAAYLCDSELRNFPECIGAISGAVTLVDDCFRKKDKVDWDIVEAFAVVSIALSVLMILTILISLTLGVGLFALFAPLDGLVITFTSICNLFLASIKLFQVEMTVAIGIGMLGVIVESVCLLKKRYIEKHNYLSDDSVYQEDNDEEEDDEDDEEDEEDDDEDEEDDDYI